MAAVERRTPSDSAATAPDEQQARWLAESLASAKRAGLRMRRAIDEGSLRDALRCANELLGELRTSLLAPQKYYELYVAVTGELLYLRMFFEDEVAKGRGVAGLYELVQHAGNVLPRLYLLVTVGYVYVKSGGAPSKEVLRDLVEMSKGVQHPTRGLFLRTYLAQTTRGLLPDAGSEFEGEGGSLADAVDFTLQNFTSMNKLWVRMQRQGKASQRARRERERQELRDLVGKNLLILGQLEGVDVEVYGGTVLPRALEQVVACKDEIAQHYLMDCIVEGFPLEYHLETLGVLLAALPKLHPSVDAAAVLQRIADRIAAHAASGAEGAAEEVAAARACELVLGCCDAIASAEQPRPRVAIVSAYSAALALTLRLRRDRIEMVDELLARAAAALSAPRAAGEGAADEDYPALERAVVALLTAPLDAYDDVIKLLELRSYPAVAEVLAVGTRRAMAAEVVRSLIRSGRAISSRAKAERLFSFVALLVEERADVPVADDEDLEEEQGLVARMLLSLWSDDAEECMAVLEVAKERLERGGPARSGRTLPTLAFAALRLLRAVRSRGAAGGSPPGEEGEGEEKEGEEEEGAAEALTPKKVLQFLHRTISLLHKQGGAASAPVALRLFLQCAAAADEAGDESIAYEFYTQAFELYEEELADSKAQQAALAVVVGTLCRARNLGAENREALVSKATQYSSRLLKKPARARAAALCSHLFWTDREGGTPGAEGGGGEGATQEGGAEGGDAGGDGGVGGEPYRDPANVLMCLKRALKLANAAEEMASSVGGGANEAVSLYVEILNKYLYFFDRSVPGVTAAMISDLVELIGSDMSKLEGEVAEGTKAFFQATLARIASKRAAGDAPQYAELVLPA